MCTYVGIADLANKRHCQLGRIDEVWGSEVTDGNEGGVRGDKEGVGWWEKGY